MSAALRFAVLQPGARRHYAVPAILARHGRLARLYTDLCADKGLLRRVAPLWPVPLRPKPARRLLGRRLPADLPRERVTHLPAAALLGRALGFDVERRLIARVAQDGFAGADALYTFLVNADLDLVRRAKDKGLAVVHDVILGPDVGGILTRERAAFPGVERGADPDAAFDDPERDARKYRLADRILVPSPFTRDAVLALGADPGKVAVVPFGLDLPAGGPAPAPVPGRVLFVGTVGLRKGSHHLASAARILRSRDVPCVVRVVGPHGGVDLTTPLLEGPAYAGQVPRAAVAREFASADLLVLPTLCDSFALVQLEALARGVPVVATARCGAVVRDGRDGFVVPAGDPEALADAIARIVADRHLRAVMSRNARERAADFTLERYGERLLEALAPLDRPLDRAGAAA